MKKNRLFVLAFLFILINFYAFTQNSNLADRYFLDILGFSFCPPTGSKEMELNGNKIFVGVPINNYAPIIYFSIHGYGDSLEKTIDELILFYENNTINFSLLSIEDFLTDNKIICKRIVVTYELSTVPIMFIHYFFENSIYKFSISSTATLDFGEEYFKILDESIKTLQWLN